MTGGVPEGAPPVGVCCCVVLLRGPTGVPGAVGPGCGAVLRRGRRPAREPSALRAFGSARRLVVRPGLGLLHVAQLWLSIITFACNSPAACSNIEFASLELQRFLGLLKFGPIELHAKFVWLWSCDRPPAPWRVPAARGPPVPSGPSAPSGPFRPPDPPVPSALVGPGVLSWLAATLPRVRYKILPVRAKHAKLGHLGRAGRALYRTCGEKG